MRSSGCSVRIASIQPCASRRAIARAALGLQQRVLQPGPRVVDVEVGRHDVVVARRSPPAARRRERLRHAGSAARTRRACSRTSGPAADCRSAGRGRRRGRRRPRPRGSGCACRPGRRAARADFDRLRAPREDRDAVPGRSGRARPRRSPASRIAFAGKRLVGRLELLQAGDVRRFRSQPLEQARQARPMPLTL